MVCVLELDFQNECIFYESLTIAQSDLSAMDPSSTNQKNIKKLNYINQQFYEHQEALLLKSSVSKLKKTPNMRHPSPYMHPTQPIKHASILELTCLII